MMATPGDPFDSSDYLFEVKWDGYRAMAYLNEETRLQSRNLKNFTRSYPNLLDLHIKVEDKPVILDGEIISLKDGKPTFQGLQGIDPTKPSIFIAFDILYHKGKSVMEEPLIKRKEILKTILREDVNLIFSQHVLEFGKEFYKHCIENQLEGVIAKQLLSPYLPGKRVSFWKKFKGVKEDDFIIVGYLPGKASVIGSLALGKYINETLVFKGLVGTGLSENFKLQLMELFIELKVDENPFKVKIAELRNCTFLFPHLVCAVNYLEETYEGRLRHPSFQSLRHDKFAKDLIE